ncbi:hypothetical protein [Gordonia sp. CPCC 205333]|uniref:hypothetical protein n=1 Tax=Gordonia sp. CPCC 205333 TaxID=3140790 RepID=UPI003AF36E3D
MPGIASESVRLYLASPSTVRIPSCTSIIEIVAQKALRSLPLIDDDPVIGRERGQTFLIALTDRIDTPSTVSAVRA